MIVTCASCQTRFRIADEKIGAKGARVRCGRCKAMFVVRVEPPPPAREAPPPEPPPRVPEPPAAPEPPTAAEPPAAPGPPAAAEPPRAPESSATGLDIELTSDPFALPRQRRDDPFARLATPDPFAATPVDPFAAPPPGDPFAPPRRDPFEAAQLTPPPAAAGATEPEGVAPAPTGGIALEEGGRRSQPTPMPGYETAFGLPADFRTPGPSGLEVAERPNEAAEPAAALPALAPSPSLAPSPPPSRAVPPVPPPTAPEPEPDEPPRPLRQRAASLLVNSVSLVVLLLLAGALFVTWRGGGIGAVWATLGRSGDGALAARHVESGLYDTAGGRPALFVRGQVVSAEGSNGPVRVRVELLDGERKVAGAEGLSGALPTPEEIWSVRTPEEEARLRAELATRGVRLGPNQPVPFLVVLWDHPVDLRGLDLRVVAEPSAGR